MTTQYLYDANDIAQEISGEAVLATYLGALGIDEPFVRDGATTEYYHADALGSVLALTGHTAIAQTHYAYDVFGKTVATGVTSANPFLYAGRENEISGLYYYRARYYNPTLQRFVSEDPIGFAGGVNLYAYVDNNPNSARDPFGLCSDPGGLGIRYCIQAFIPERVALIYLGDNRGHTCDDPPGTKNFRANQSITQNGTQSQVQVGRTTNVITRNSARGIQGPHAATPYPLNGGGLNIRATNKATNGLYPDAPPLWYDIIISQDASGDASVIGTGSGFPDIEVCQYGGPNGTKGFHFPHQGMTPLAPFELYNTRLLLGPLK